MKLLDETDARTILLLAPAGYGKTTLARQWARTLNGLVAIRLRADHRDVAVLAEDLAVAIDSEEGQGVRLIREHIRARKNAQRAAREIGTALADLAAARHVKWLWLDDYHEVAGSSSAEMLLRALLDREGFRLLVTSRTRPRWVTGRALLYGEVSAVTRDDLAMTEDEVIAVLGDGATARSFVQQAAGWPAVISLAATVGPASFPTGALPLALHDYLAQELYSLAAPQLQEALIDLALFDHRPVTGDPRRIEEPDQLMQEAIALGFSSSDRGFELHPLMSEFLLEKLAERSDATERVRAAVAAHLAAKSWSQALDLVVRFRLDDLVEPALTAAFTPLVRSGRVETLARFITAVQRTAAFPPPVVDVAQAEIALRDGSLELARDLAGRAASRLSSTDPLVAHASTIIGQVSFLLSDFAAAEECFTAALSAAADERAEAEALRGLASATVFGERPGAHDAVEALRGRSQRSPVDLLRFVTTELLYKRFGGVESVLRGSLGLDAARQALAQAEDPVARTAMTYAAVVALSLRAEYQEATDWLAMYYEDARRFGLDFTLPYADWTAGMVALGLRRFGDAERSLQAVEDAATRDADSHHHVNALTLRARLLLQTGEIEAALRCVRTDPEGPLMPSWKGEYFATRALACAAAGLTHDATVWADEARKMTSACDVQVLAMVAMAIAQPTAVDPCDVMREAQRTAVWDPLVCGVRTSPALAEALASDESLRLSLEALYSRTNDLALARKAGFRTRSTSDPFNVLSPREQEVLGLITRGMTNREISRALFIADSTTKVHVRHILEKLGVRTRSEAVARFESFRLGLGRLPSDRGDRKI